MADSLSNLNQGAYADGHCHLQDTRFATPGGLDSILKDPQVAYIVVNGCCPDDWFRVLDLWKAYPDVILPQLGLHPWWVSQHKEENSSWLSVLERVLKEYPMVGLGECGLDRSGMRAATYAEQKEAFDAQIQLAITLGRPISVHCVQAYGNLFTKLSVVKECVPVLLHGWSGSAEMTRMFASEMKNVYFSINLGITRLDPERARNILNAIPIDRCVLESDGPDGVLTKDRWDVWCAHIPRLRHMIEASGMQHRVQDAHELGKPSNVILVACIVAALTDTCPSTIMSSSISNIKQIFSATQSNIM